VATFTANDKALGIAYPSASQIAGQVADLSARKYALNNAIYAALGAEGIAGIAPNARTSKAKMLSPGSSLCHRFIERPFTRCRGSASQAEPTAELVKPGFSREG
jgi:hypothetical protein